MGITIKPITADDVVALEAQNVVREIVNGEWVEKTEMAGKLTAWPDWNAPDSSAVSFCHCE